MRQMPLFRAVPCRSSQCEFENYVADSCPMEACAYVFSASYGIYEGEQRLIDVGVA